MMMMRVVVVSSVAFLRVGGTAVWFILKREGGRTRPCWFQKSVVKNWFLESPPKGWISNNCDVTFIFSSKSTCNKLAQLFGYWAIADHWAVGHRSIYPNDITKVRLREGAWTEKLWVRGFYDVLMLWIKAVLLNVIEHRVPYIFWLIWKIIIIITIDFIMYCTLHCKISGCYRLKNML